MTLFVISRWLGFSFIRKGSYVFWIKENAGKSVVHNGISCYGFLLNDGTAWNSFVKKFLKLTTIWSSAIVAIYNLIDEDFSLQIHILNITLALSVNLICYTVSQCEINLKCTCAGTQIRNWCKIAKSFSSWFLRTNHPGVTVQSSMTTYELISLHQLPSISTPSFSLQGTINSSIPFNFAHLAYLAAFQWKWAFAIFQLNVGGKWVVCV